MKGQRLRGFAIASLSIAFIGFAASSHAAGKLVGAWAFDAGSGATAADATGNGHNGSVVGATWTTGKFGGALQFNGDGDHVAVAHSEALNLSKLTVTTWVQPKAWNPELNTIVQKWDDSGNKRQYLLNLYQQKPIWYVSSNGLNFPNAFGATVNELDQWIHIAGSYDGAVIKVYLNGVLEKETAQADGAFKSDTPFLIGGYGPNATVQYGTNRHFNGVIDEVQLFDDALTEAEINTIMNTPIGNPTAVAPKNKLAATWANLKSR